MTHLILPILLVSIALLTELNARCIATVPDFVPQPNFILLSELTAANLKSVRYCGNINFDQDKYPSVSQKQYGCMHSKHPDGIRCMWTPGSSEIPGLGIPEEISGKIEGFQDILLMIDDGIMYASHSLCANYKIMDVQTIFDGQCKPVLTARNLQEIYEEVINEAQLADVAKLGPWKKPGVWKNCESKVIKLLQGNHCPESIWTLTDTLKKPFLKTLCRTMLVPKRSIEESLTRININLPKAVTPMVCTIKKDGRYMQEIQNWFINAFIALQPQLSHDSFMKTFDIDWITNLLTAQLKSHPTIVIDDQVILSMVHYIFETINKRIDIAANQGEANVEWQIPKNDYSFSTIMYRYNHGDQTYKELKRQLSLYHSQDADPLSKERWARLFSQYLHDELRSLRTFSECPLNNMDCVVFVAWTSPGKIAYDFSKTFRCDVSRPCCQQLQEKYLLFNMQFKHAYKPKNLVLDLGKGKTIDLKWKGKHLFHGINGMCLPEKVRQSFEFVKGSVTTAKGLYELSFTGPKSFSTERNTAKHFMDTGVKSFGFMLKINLGKHTTGHSPADVKSISVFSEENEVLLYDMSKVEILAVEYWGDYEAQCDPERIASTYQLGDISCLKSFSLRDISCKNKHGGPIENQGSFLFRPLLVRHSVHIGYENILNDKLLDSQNHGLENELMIYHGNNEGKNRYGYSDENKFPHFYVVDNNNNNNYIAYFALLVAIGLICCVIGCIVGSIGCLFGIFTATNIPTKDLCAVNVSQ
eukprot:417856_1